MIDGCLPKQQHYRSQSRVQTLVVVVATDDSAETGNNGAGGTSRIGWRWGGGGVRTAAAA